MYWILRKDQLQSLNMDKLISSYPKTNTKRRYLMSILKDDELFRDVDKDIRNFKYKLQKLDDALCFVYNRHNEQQITLDGKRYAVTILDDSEQYVCLSTEHNDPIIENLGYLRGVGDNLSCLTDVVGVSKHAKKSSIIPYVYIALNNGDVLQNGYHSIDDRDSGPLSHMVFPHESVLGEFNVSLSGVDKEEYSLERLILDRYMKALLDEQHEFKGTLDKLKNVSPDEYTFCGKAYASRLINMLVLDSLIKNDKFYMLLGKYRVVVSEKNMIEYLLSRPESVGSRGQEAYTGGSRYTVSSSADLSKKDMKEYLDREIEKRDKSRYTVSSSADLSKKSSKSKNDLDDELDKHVQQRLQQKADKQYSFDDLAPKQVERQPQKKEGLMKGLMGLLKTNFKSPSDSSNEVKEQSVRDETSSAVKPSISSYEDTSKTFKPNIKVNGTRVILDSSCQNANIVLPDEVESIVVYGCSRLNGLYVNSNARVLVKQSTNRLVINHLILGSRATEFLPMNNSLIIYPLKVTSREPMKFTGRQLYNLLCFMIVFNNEVIKNEAYFFVGEGVNSKPWSYPYTIDKREFKEAFAATRIIYHSTDRDKIVQAIRQRYQITFDTEYCSREFYNKYYKRLSERSIRKEFGFENDDYNRYNYTSCYHDFIAVLDKLTAVYSLRGY